MQFVTSGIESLSRRISLAGLASRRDAERAILNGLVTVDGLTVRSGCKVADTSLVLLSGQFVPPPGDPQLFGCIKPRGVVGQMAKSEGKQYRSLSDMYTGRFIVVNKVPTMANGLVLLTRDSELARTLVAKESKILTTLRIRSGVVTDTQLDIARKWKNIPKSPIWVELEKRTSTQSWLKVRVLTSVDLNDLSDFFWHRAKIHTNRINVVAIGPYTVNDILDQKDVIQLGIRDSIRHLVKKREIAPVLIKNKI